MMPFSVCMAVYGRDNAEHIMRALDSLLIHQTVKPDELIIVRDGSVPAEIEDVLKNYEAAYPLVVNVIRLPQNKGLGHALRIGVEAAAHEIIARMDSDDIALPERFEKQISYMERHPDCIVLGGQISEFIDEETNIVGYRMVPCTYRDILMWLKGRCPFNHMSVTLRRSPVVAAGGYLDWYCNEDYYLWIRLAEAGCRFANLPDTLVNVRVGRDMYRRRGGWRYFKSEARLQRYMLGHRLISLPRYAYNVAGRFFVQVAMPNWLRGIVFQKLFRK